MTARWRLQLLAEMGFGRLSRVPALQEEADYTRLKETTSGPR